jgi:amino acid adenylation domain-containing protein
LNSHHIVTDGWSLGILLGELRSHYQDLMGHRSFTAAALPIQYVDFVLWQRETLTSENLAPHVAYWRRQLADAPVLELPTDRPRPAVQVFRGENLAVRFPAGLSDALQAVGRGQGATPAMTLLAGFFALLSRHSEQERMVVGSPMANRGVREVEGLIGFFVNSLPLLGDVSGGSVSVSFRRLLGRVRDMALDAYRYQDLPFEKLVEDLKPERDLSRNPFFQVLFALQRFPVKGSWGGGLTVEPLIGHSEDEGFEGGFQPTRLDLELHLWEDTGDLAGFCSFDRALFDSTTIQRLMGHFIILLGDMAENPDAGIAELPLLTSGERHQLLVEWNGTGVSFENSVLLHEVFQAQAERYPEALAVVGEGEMLSYGALEVRSNRLAWFLRASWEEPRCGLFIERSLEMMIGLLGILKAGGAYVPLEVSHPAQRLSSLLGDAGLPDGRMKVLLTHSGVAERLPEHDLPQVLLDRDWGQINKSPQLPPVAWQARPDQLAYVIYTSGSTGRPKGVMNTHRGVLNRLLWMQQQYRLRRTDRVLQKTPLSFDVSVWELFWPLMNGAPLVLARPEGHRDSLYLTRLIERERVNVLHFVPSMLAAFLKDLEGKSSKVGPIELVIASGEALSSDLARRFREQAWVARAQLHNLYGPTEAAIDVSHFRCDGGGHDAVMQGAVTQGAVMLSAGVSIGRPVANTRLYLFGRAFRTVPLGVAGELYLAGVQVARGYLGRPGLTAERFVPAPFPDTHRPDLGGRMYRTGDLARFLADGNVEFLGRLDHQVKIRGYRIELGEIEAVLGQHPGVRAVCVVICAFHQGEQRLVACVVGTETSSRVLREVLRTKVPEYMVPTTFLHLEALPLLPNGKIDRRTLVSRALEAIEAPASAASPTKAPHTPAEQILAGIWREVLFGEEKRAEPRLIGAGDDFFALGGHSLLATQVISRIRQHFGLELTVRELFEAPTLAALGRRLEAARRSRDGVEGVAAGQMAAPPALKPRPDDGPPPLSFGQQRLWFLDRLVPNSSFYNLGGSLRLRGGLDWAALEGALGEVVRRHESLRTTVASVDGAPVQVIHPWAPPSDGPARGPGRLSLRQVDLGSLPIAVREVEARRLAREDGEQPFDLVAGPLFRALLLCLGEGEHELFLTLHHLISDGWSLGVLEGEVAVIYGALRSRQPSPLPDLLIQYADFTVWQRQWLPKALAARLAWWKEQVGEDPPLLELPTDHPRPAVQRFRGAVLPVRLGMGLSSSLQALGRQRGGTLAMTLLAGFYTLLYRITGQEKILVGSPFAGRTQWETEGMIGLLVNNLALVGDLSVPRGGDRGGDRCGDRCDFWEVLGRVREMTLGAQAFQDLPLERLVEELHLERDLSRNPLFQVIFAYQNVPLEEPKFDGLEVQRRGFEAQTTRFDVELHLGDTVDGLAGLCTYDRDLFDATTIQRMMGHYSLLLKTIVQSPRTALGDLGWFSTAEEHQLVVEWSGTTTDSAATNREEDHSLGALF